VTRSLTFQVLSFATTSGTASGLVAPVITYAPEALMVPVGAAADFAVATTGSVGGYRWWKRVGGLDTELVAAGSSPWLTIDRAALSDAADYYVEVLDAASGAASVNSVPVPLAVVPLGE
jgi:hypothetical protein